MRPIQRIRTVAIVAIIAVLAGCSGKDPGGTAASSGSEVGATGVGATFAGQAVEVCNRSLEDKGTWAPFPVANFNPFTPDSSAFPQVSAWLSDEVAPTFQAWLDGLEALGPPPSGQDAWNDVLAAVKRIGQLNEDQIAAADSGERAPFAAATAALDATQDDLVAATEAAGVPECAEVHA